MILILDRRGGTIGGGGVYVPVDASGEVLRPWCLAAMANGYDLAGMDLFMWDRGADARTDPLLCVTVRNAAALVTPRPPENRSQRRGRKAR